MLQAMGRLILLVAFVVCFGAASAFAYNYTNINYPGAAQSDAFGITSDGNVVVGNYYDAYGNQLGMFTYNTTTGVYTPVARPTPSTSLAGINHGRVMTGSSLSGSNIIGYIRNTLGGFAWFSYPGAYETQPRGINDSGDIAGYFRWNSADTAHCFVKQGGTYTVFRPKASPLSCVAQGLNGQGTSTGHVWLPAGAVYPNSPKKEYGWKRTIYGNYRIFSVNGRRTFARGINDSLIVVGYSVGSIGADPHGFAANAGAITSDYQNLTVPQGYPIWSATVDYPGATGTYPQAISNYGTIVGNWIDVSGRAHGFLAR